MSLKERQDWDRYPPDFTKLFEGDPAQRMRASLLAKMARGRVLDVACGDGFISDLMRRRGLEVTACDISNQRVKAAKRLFDADVAVADVRCLPFPDRSFDTVVAGEILEHLDPLSDGLAEIERVCGEGGQILISLPIGNVFGVDRTHRWWIEPLAVSDSGGRCELLQNRYMFIVLRLQRWKYSEWRKQHSVVGEDNDRTENNPRSS